MKYVCKTRCFWGNRQWSEGDTVTMGDDVDVPHHFEPVEGEPKKTKGKKGDTVTVGEGAPATE